MKHKSIALLIYVLTLFSISTNIYGEDVNWKILEVPSSIEVNQEVSTVPEGWQPSKEESKHILAGITIFDGRPKEIVSLVYDSEVKQQSKHRMILGWKLFPNTKDGIWIRCSYSSTNMGLSAPVPTKAKEIRVVYDTNIHIDGLPQIVQIEYRE